VKRELGSGYELDDDRSRIDREAVHAFLTRSYWAEGRLRAVQDSLIDASERVVGLYHHGRQVGFSRTVSDGHVHSYLADVYVLEEHRGSGLGVELVRFSVDEGAFADTRWVLHTADAHELYRRFGFDEPSARVLERAPSQAGVTTGRPSSSAADAMRES
jgi:GNAT superfamily N-acetyltransferase